VALRKIIASLLGLSAYAPPKGYGPELDERVVEMVREQMGGQLQPLPRTHLRWYLDDLETAQHAADAGNLEAAAQLYRAMRRDGVLSGLLGTRTSGLVRLPKQFYGDQEIADVLRKNNGTRSVFDEMFPPAEVSALASDGIVLGVGIAEMVPVEGRDYPVLVRLDPEFLQYIWSENRWYFISIAGRLPITPGDGRWILHTPGPRMSPWTFGLWPALGRSFINKEHAMMSRSNFSGKLANPARAAIAPAGATEPQRVGLLKALIRWGLNTTFELPPGWDVKLIESNGRGREVFQDEINTSDQEYMVALAGQIVTTTGGSGFAGTNDMFRQIRADLVQDTGETLAYTLNTQGLPQFIVNRWGEDALLDELTTMQWDTRTPKDLEADARTMGGLGQGIQQLDAALAPHDREVDIRETLVKYGIAIRERKDRLEGGAKEAPALVPSPVRNERQAA
jgi:hypothetical protein